MEQGCEANSRRTLTSTITSIEKYVNIISESASRIEYKLENNPGKCSDAPACLEPDDLQSRLAVVLNKLNELDQTLNRVLNAIGENTSKAGDYVSKEYSEPKATGIRRY